MRASRGLSVATITIADEIGQTGKEVEFAARQIRRRRWASNFGTTPPSLHAAPPNSHSHSLTLTACLTPPVAHPPTHSASPELDMMDTPWAAAGRCWPGATVGGDAHGKRGTNGTWTGVEERVSKFLTWDARRPCPTPKPSVFNNGCPPRLLSFSFSPQPISQFSSLTIILTSVVHSF